MCYWVFIELGIDNMFMEKMIGKKRESSLHELKTPTALKLKVNWVKNERGSDLHASWTASRMNRVGFLVCGLVISWIKSGNDAFDHYLWMCRCTGRLVETMCRWRDEEHSRMELQRVPIRQEYRSLFHHVAHPRNLMVLILKKLAMKQDEQL